MTYTCLKKEKWSVGNYTLIPIRQEDMERVRVWRNEQIAILRQKKPLTPEEQVRYFEEQVKPSFLLKEPRNVLFSFLKDKTLIGYGGIVHVDWQAQSGEISFLLGKPDAQDLAALISLLVEAAFQGLELKTLIAEVYDWGTERKVALEQAGFTASHTRASTKTHNGKTANSIFYKKQSV